MKIFLVVYFMVVTNICLSQNITGTWVGNYGGTILMSKPQQLVVEIFIANDSLVTGGSHLYYKNNKYEHYTIKGLYNKKDSTISFIEDSVIAIKLDLMASVCLGKYKMKLNVSDTLLKFEGRWKDKSTSIFKCPSSTVWLTKKIEKTKTQVVKIADSRVVVIQSLLEIKKQDADSIKVEIYDNGEVDNDSISMYFNDSVIVNKKMISVKPITFYINLTSEQPISKLKLIAESVGSIPPCTALMIVTTKHKRYDVNLSSDFNKSGVVELFLKE